MTKLIKQEVKTCETLLDEYLVKNAPVTNPVKLLIEGVGGRDVYNITAPFEDEGERKDLVEVVFSGGLVRRGDGTAEIYAGISDAEAHRITIPDPFLKFERRGESGT